MAPPTALPIMMAGRTRLMSFAANGIAPSVIPIRDMKNAEIPKSLSSAVYFFRSTNVEIAIANGGIAQAIRCAPFGPYTPSAIKANVNAVAVLLIGPPISTAVIAPKIKPRISALPPCICPRTSTNQSIATPIGTEIT